jgi:hypothetical protein
MQMERLRFLRAVAPITVAMGVAAGSALAALPISAPKLRVTPATGTPSSTFTVVFRAPAASGRSGSFGMLRRYELSASGPAGASGCVDSLSLAPTATRAGQWLHVKLRPAARRAGWCPGEWSGAVNEVALPACGPVVARAGSVLCPQYIELVDRIGRFAFSVGAGG